MDAASLQALTQALIGAASNAAAAADRANRPAQSGASLRRPDVWKYSGRDDEQANWYCWKR